MALSTIADMSLVPAALMLPCWSFRFSGSGLNSWWQLGVAEFQEGQFSPERYRGKQILGKAFVRRWKQEIKQRTPCWSNPSHVSSEIQLKGFLLLSFKVKTIKTKVKLSPWNLFCNIVFPSVVYWNTCYDALLNIKTSSWKIKVPKKKWKW